MTKHTPGPWVIDWDTFPDGYVWVETTTGRAVALVDEAIRADLNLIAAVPDLLEALHQISIASQNSMSTKEECGRIARAAIKKATGEE